MPEVRDRFTPDPARRNVAAPRSRATWVQIERENEATHVTDGAYTSGAKQDTHSEAGPAAAGSRAMRGSAQAEIDHPSSQLVRFSREVPLLLDSGKQFGPFQIAFDTYGTLNPEKTNAVLICHALTGDQYVARTHPVTGKPGWWETLVGPGKPVDTDRFFVICPNILGGCMGSTGPASMNPDTGKPYGLEFPVITIGDMVKAQARLIDHLGIADLFAVVGGSMGGMQVLEWAARYRHRVFAAVPIAAASRHTEHRLPRGRAARRHGRP